MEIRKSHTAENKIYFWTATIRNWLPLLQDDANKQIIIDSLHYLSHKGLITVFAFVIMPNHIHLIWRLNARNGKESAKGSFMKFTAHKLMASIIAAGNEKDFISTAANKKHEIWQRDALGIEIYSKSVAVQKLSYIHLNPVSKKWLLAKDDIGYRWSSANYYENHIDDFGFLNNILHYFDGV